MSTEPGTETPAPEQQPPAEAPAAEETETVDFAAEAEHWREQARKQEKRAKSNADAAKKLQELERQSMSDQEKAVNDARAETARMFGGRLVRSEIKAAAAGRNIDVEALAEHIDATAFLDSDGEPDQAAITAWIERLAPEQEPASDLPPFPDLGQGQRGSVPALNSSQIEQDLKAKLGI